MTGIPGTIPGIIPGIIPGATTGGIALTGAGYMEGSVGCMRMGCLSGLGVRLRRDGIGWGMIIGAGGIIGPIMGRPVGRVAMGGGECEQRPPVSMIMGGCWGWTRAGGGDRLRLDGPGLDHGL